MTTVNKNICMRLIEAQKEFPRIVQDQEAKAFGSGRGYSYANISSCLDTILPILNKHGLAVVQKTTTEEDRVGIETVLVSEEGETLSSGVFFVTTKRECRRSGAQSRMPADTPSFLFSA